MSKFYKLVSSDFFARLKLSLSAMLLLIAFQGNTQTLTDEFVDAGYSITELGSVPGVPTNYGGLTIRPEEPNTLYIGGNANAGSGALYSITLLRDPDTGSIIGFDGSSTLVVAAPDNDGGIVYAPNGTLLFTQYSQNGLGQVLPDDTYITTDLNQYGIASSVGSLAFVPEGFSGAGNLLIASYSASIVYTVPFTISESGEYMLSNPTASVSVSGLANGPEGIAFVPPGSDGFENPSMVISAYSANKVVAFEVDDAGMPIPETSRDMVQGLSGAEGAWIDPVTGDFLFSTFGSGNSVFIVNGFQIPVDCPELEANIGDECDDEDANTENDLVTDACECIGTSIWDCPELLANIGDNCNDGDDGTENDLITAECNCEGTLIVYDCPELEANIGDACDDGNELTENDLIGENCQCQGTTIPVENTALLCADGIDNDGDGFSDCDDPDCQALSAGCETCFSDGTSFADVVLDYNNTCPNNTATDPSLALGVPEYASTGNGFVTLGEGGHVTLGFTDNTLVNSGTDDPDLFVFEIGPLVEGSTIELRPSNEEVENIISNAGIMDQDDDGFYEFGSISGATAVVDIDSFFDDIPANTLFFDAIKIVDIPGGCSGTTPGADIDGVCALSSVACNVGGTCDDGDPNTENDTLNEDCECIGEPIAVASVLELECGGSVIQITNAVAGDNGGGTATADTRTIYAFAPDGDGDVPTFEGNTWPYVFIDGSLNVDDAITAALSTNTDGVLLVNGSPAYQFVGDTDPSDATGTFGPWSYYLLDGTPSQDACPPDFDCPELEANFGDPCDDGDENTENDTVNENCMCSGTSIWDCPDLLANIGDSCDDGDDTTENDTVDSSCNCAGTPIIVWDCPDIEANIGDACDDGDEYTENDVIGSDCNCAGTSIWDCPELLANVGDECDDGNDDLIPGIVNEDCECEESTTFDCPELEANIGDPCDDGDENTEDDMVTENCICEGIPTLIWDCPELEANFGDDCDDGNPDTENDMVGTDCSCMGTPIEPSDCNDYAIFLNDNEGGETDIYRVDISSGDAILAYITTLDFHAHMAFNEEDKLLYVVNNSTGFYVTVDPGTGEVSAPVMLSEDIPGITTAVFAPNGKLLVGSSTDDVIYSIDLTDASVSTFDGYAPVSGGDIEFDATGKLYLASRSGNGLYEVYPDDVQDDQFLANIPSLVTGMALTDGDQLLTSHNGNSDLILTNLDGSATGTSYPLMLDGEAFMHHNGDLASGCNDSDDVVEGPCIDFSTYYADINRPGVSGTDIYSVAFTESGDAELTFLTNVNFDAHIAFDGQSGLLYLVNQNGSFIRVYDPNIDASLGDLPIIGGYGSSVAVVFNPADDLIYIGSDNDQVYTVDLDTGIATDVFTAPVSGGDLALQDGRLFLATRSGAKLHEIIGGVATEVGDIPPLVNGMTHTNSTSELIIANRNADVFSVISMEDGSTTDTFTPVIGGDAVTLYDGDMASGCRDINPGFEGSCYAAEILDYSPGTLMGGGELTEDRTDPNQAINTPERTDELVFTSLGYGGSIILTFGGDIVTGEGPDLEIVETSYGNPGCEAYPEYANVFISYDVGENWTYIGNVCKANPYIDLDEAEVQISTNTSYEPPIIRIENDDENSTSSDGFDLDGIVALHNNCPENGSQEGEEDTIIVESANQLTSFPNPTNGASQVVFNTGSTERTQVDVYDMNGRKVTTLFNQVAQANQEYRLDFDASDLPNGVYIYRLTTTSETIIEKFMLAK